MLDDLHLRLRQRLKRTLGIEALQTAARDIFARLSPLEGRVDRHAEELKTLAGSRDETAAAIAGSADELAATRRELAAARDELATARNDLAALKAQVAYTINRDVCITRRGKFAQYQFSDDFITRGITQSAQLQHLVISLEEARRHVEATVAARPSEPMEAAEAIREHWTWASPDLRQFNTIHRGLLACLKATGCSVDFVDVGACMADTALVAADTMMRLGMTGRTISFEPGPIFELARATICLNQMEDRIELVNAAASDADGYTPMRIMLGHSESGSIGGIDKHYPDLPVGETRMVRTVRLDTFFAHRPGALYVKIDAEGHDFQVIDGAKSLIDGGRVLVIHLEVTPKYMRPQDPGILQALCGRYALFNLRTLDEAGTFNRLDSISADEVRGFLAKASNYHGWTDAVLIDSELAESEPFRALASGRP